MGIANKIIERFQDKGLKEGAKSIAKSAASHVVDANREVILLKLDLSNPKAHRKKKEIERYDFDIQPFDASHFDPIAKMLRSSEPDRIDQIRMRLDDGTPGWVTYEDGEVVAYVFYETNAPGRAPYPDLEWLGIELCDREVYSFDSFIPPALRGRGIPMFRATYQALFESGFTHAYGYVWAWDTAPLWSYRVTGWQEFGRFTEHRIAGRFAIVGGVLYELERFKRRRIVKIPFGERLHEFGSPT